MRSATWPRTRTHATTPPICLPPWLECNEICQTRTPFSSALHLTIVCTFNCLIAAHTWHNSSFNWRFNCRSTYINVAEVKVWVCIFFYFSLIINSYITFRWRNKLVLLLHSHCFEIISIHASASSASSTFPRLRNNSAWYLSRLGLEYIKSAFRR